MKIQTPVELAEELAHNTKQANASDELRVGDVSKYYPVHHTGVSAARFVVESRDGPTFVVEVRRVM